MVTMRKSFSFPYKMSMGLCLSPPQRLLSCFDRKNGSARGMPGMGKKDVAKCARASRGFRNDP